MVPEQIEQDIQTSTKTLEDAKAALTKLHKELAKLKEQVAASEVCQLKIIKEETADNVSE